MYSIRCYRKRVINNEVYNNDGEVDCLGQDDDRCGTLSYTVDFSIKVSSKNCTRSAVDCNQKEVCERLKTHVKNQGYNLVSNCSVVCCDSDYCNAPGKKVERML